MRNESNKEMQADAKAGTRRKTTTQRLTDSELKYRHLFEAAQDGILILNGDTGHIIDANPFVTDLLGYTRQELLGKQLWQIGAFKDIDASKIAYTELQQKNYIRYNCFPLETKDKRLIDVEFVSNAYQVDGSRIIQCNIRDVTAHMKLDLLLRQKGEQSEEKHRILFETMVQGVVYQDAHGKIIVANPAAERILGLTIDQMIGRTSLDARWRAIHEDGTEFPGETHPAMVALQTGKPVMNTVMGVFHPAEESYYWILINAVPQFRPNEDRPCQVYTTFTDITQLKQSEAALRESDERYQALLDRSNDLVYLHDFKGKFIEVNVTVLTLLGYKKEEIIGHDFTSILSKDQISTAVKVLREIKKNGTQKELSEYRLKCKNGNYIYVETKETAVYRNGKPYAILGIGRDITERKQSEELLKASEEKLRLIFESVTDGITITDLEGKVLDFNKAVVRLHKYNSKEQLIGKNFLELIVDKDRHLAYENMKKALGEGYSGVIEYTLLTKNRRRFAAKLSIALIRDNDRNPLGFVTITKDITERKKIEAQKKLMEQKAQLNSRMAAIGEMASGIGHEINNPLTGVIGYAQLLQKMDVPPDIREAVDVIDDGAQRVADIVKRLLTFARNQKPEREYVSVNEILETTLVLRRYSLETNNIKLTPYLDPDLPLTVANSGQLQQVFLNLIINAEWEMKHAHGKGKLIITTKRLDDIIRISIKDNGPGVASENMERIFDPFFTTKEVGEGTGLGLSICHEIISEHGGKMFVESQAGKGATFIVELPVLSKVEQKKQVKEGTQKHTPIARAKILVVDDEVSIGTFLKQVLIEAGHEVDTVDNANKALAKIRNEEYDLILMDIKMPGMSGITLYDHVKKITPVLGEKILFITGDILGADTKVFLKNTKARYIKKPFDINKLMKEINGVLNRDQSGYQGNQTQKENTYC